jgi:hypothetical protein
MGMQQDQEQFIDHLPRLSNPLSCWCESTGTTMFVQMSSLAIDGAFLRTAIPLAVGQQVVLKWMLPGDTNVEVAAEVVWNSKTVVAGHPEPGMALKFVDVLRGAASFRTYLSTAPTVKPNVY